jgi:hypothetical protein
MRTKARLLQSVSRNVTASDVPGAQVASHLLSSGFSSKFTARCCPQSTVEQVLRMLWGTVARGAVHRRHQALYIRGKMRKKVERRGYRSYSLVCVTTQVRTDNRRQ